MPGAQDLREEANNSHTSWRGPGADRGLWGCGDVGRGDCVKLWVGLGESWVSMKHVVTELGLK